MSTCVGTDKSPIGEHGKRSNEAEGSVQSSWLLRLRNNKKGSQEREALYCEQSSFRYSAAGLGETGLSVHSSHSNRIIPENHLAPFVSFS